MQCHFPFERTTGETVKTSVLPAREYTIWGLGGRGGGGGGGGGGGNWDHIP